MTLCGVAATGVGVQKSGAMTARNRERRERRGRRGRGVWCRRGAPQKERKLLSGVS